MEVLPIIANKHGYKICFKNVNKSNDIWINYKHTIQSVNKTKSGLQVCKN